ncbi:MAG TPA: diaminopimelate epimerase [Kiritimatiellia bacterium]|jgi:diaminopimelate epimerase|nr:diaminopimelate epimerase [Lentisphaerota bacterium]HRV31572.1 diaminopimelate epimerase [Kiritimatiellia bacterium]
MQLSFWKMHGAGNDFILLDDRQLSFPTDDSAGIARLCDRRRGIGSDGLLLIQPPTRPDASFRMRFFNPDGGEADLCGNGARCIARLAHEIGAAPADMQIETAAGLMRAVRLETGIRLFFPPPHDWRLNLEITAADTTWPLHFVNSGVPHAVLNVDDVATVNVAQLGPLIRHHALFAPAGTNVNFVQVTGTNSLAIRTFERGVEAETLACGTGMVAAALLATKLNWVQPPVTLTTAGGDQLIVELDPLTLTGPAEHSFRGTINH